jgi:hypothetical protein
MKEIEASVVRVREATRTLDDDDAAPGSMDALSSQRRVCPLVQPGTAKPPGPRANKPMATQRPQPEFQRCIVVASAETQWLIRRAQHQGRPHITLTVTHC